MSSWPILSLVTFLPLVGALFCLVVQGPKEAVDRNCRSAALITSLVTFLISLLLWVRFDPTKAGFQFEEKLAWVPALNIGYHMGIDGISLFFVLLSTLLTPICILASWEAVQNRVKEYMVAFLVLETFMVGMFCALDLALFYVFFEGVLIPMFLIIGVWGGKRRVYAAFKFFLYTLLGSVLMLLAIIAIYWQIGTTDIPTAFEKLNLPFRWQFWLWLAFFASFAVKVPMWPVHTWLPDAHVEAPTAGSVILAGVLLKMGGYGLIRLAFPLFPQAALYFAPVLATLSVIAIVYGALVAMVQPDMKKLVAYSSVSHMGFVILGIAAINMQGIQGASYQMLAHGVSTGALFCLVGMLSDRRHTRQIIASVHLPTIVIDLVHRHRRHIKREQCHHRNDRQSESQDWPDPIQQRQSRTEPDHHLGFTIAARDRHQHTDKQGQRQQHRHVIERGEGEQREHRLGQHLAVGGLTQKTDQLSGQCDGEQGGKHRDRQVAKFPLQGTSEYHRVFTSLR